MKHSTEHKSGGKIRTAKGFYIAVAICLLALAGVATVTFRNTTPKVDTDETTVTTRRTSKLTMPTTPTTAKQVVVPATGVPDTRTTTPKTVPVTTATTAASSGDLFIFPVSNVIVREYSDTLIFSETLGEWQTHNGVDFAAESGQKVKATADGIVLTVREDPLWGGLVEIDHGNKLVTRCYGVDATVQQGQTVRAGDVIGTVSTVPAEILDQPHVHLELIVNGNYQNPMTLIRGESVRQTATKP